MLTICLLALPLGLAPTALDDATSPDVRVNAYLMTDSLEVGKRYELAVEIELADGVSLKDAGIPAPFLQIDVPASIELEGKVLTTYQELSRNEFVQAPYERLLEELPARVAFTLLTEPGANATIGLNVVGYVTAKDGTSSFLRKRLELPLEPGAAALEISKRASTWGVESALLQIGRPAADFTLPRADGSELSLSHYLGEKNILLVTYRAYW